MYYTTSHANPLFSAVEIIPQGKGNETVFYTASQNAGRLKEWMQNTLRQTLLAQTQIDGQQALVTAGDASPQALMQELSSQGVQLSAERAEKPFNPWKWRGATNIAGQSLQLVSGYLKEGGLDAPKLMFAFSNILASIINITFGEQHNDDPHQLRALKKHFNAQFAPYVNEPSELPKTEEKRLARRGEVSMPNASQPMHQFIRHHCVRVGEMTLRFFGSLALTFPVAQWKPALASLKTEGMTAALRTARNRDNTNFYAGSVYLAGKTIGLCSKIPDPYNPAPHSVLDSVREKVFFRLSSVIETIAASSLAYGSAKHGEISLNGTKHRDYAGAAGGALLATSLTTRTFATFGVRDVNLPELEAHLTDALALAPPAMLHQLIAETAAELKEHMKEKAPSFGMLYKQLSEGLRHYHSYRQSPDGKAYLPLSKPLNRSGHTAPDPARFP